jgi:DNA modification methylase
MWSVGMNTKLLQGDCMETLKTLEAGSVQTCVTSPPYYGLRDYGTAAWVGGASDCDHTYAKGGRNPETSSGQLSNRGTLFSQYEKVCKRCGAVRVDSQIGLEETPEAYVEKLVCVFREVRRVLKDDGTLWLNLGDSYAGSGGAGGDYNNGGLKEGQPRYKSNFDVNRAKDRSTDKWSHPLKYAGNGIKPKDLIGIPWMVAFALRADGWYLRSDIIWHKPNPMPESVTDRPTKSHEYIFLLSKSAQYYYDAKAVAEPSTWAGDPRAGYGRLHYRGKREGQDGTGQENFVSITETRNKRSVWTIATQPYEGAHFATFPPKLIEPCILAGSREGDTVLDPFNGSGTTGAVAIKHHRNYIGCELNPDYIQLTNKRLSSVQPVLFPQVPS